MSDGLEFIVCMLLGARARAFSLSLFLPLSLASLSLRFDAMAHLSLGRLAKLLNVSVTVYSRAMSRLLLSFTNIGRQCALLLTQSFEQRATANKRLQRLARDDYYSRQDNVSAVDAADTHTLTDACSVFLSLYLSVSLSEHPTM